MPAPCTLHPRPRPTTAAEQPQRHPARSSRPFPIGHDEVTGPRANPLGGVVGPTHREPVACSLVEEYEVAPLGETDLRGMQVLLVR